MQSVKIRTKFILTAFTSCLLFFSYTAIAQINILPGPDVTPIDMVENIVGEGIMFDNVTFQGADASRGIFNNGETTNLGIGSGIFLTSGAGYVIPGPNTSSSAGANNSLGGHPSLNAITTATTYDAAVLEFDFVPESDTLRFKYVFGSEEYNEWVGSTYNDVFGYFVSGPDPTGGFYNDKNIAIVPGTANTSVTINNVNLGYSPPNVVPTGPGLNSQYYADNTFGLTLEYDGFTTVLIAWLLVVPCEQYHIRIGVADAGDHIYDSGVFIEENSFESPKIEVQTDPFPQGVSDNMIEGCVEADIIFRLPSPEYAPVTIYFEVGGTADPSAYPPGDFEEAIPTEITFEEDEDSVAIHVKPVYDGIIEGEETLELIIENTLGCIVRWDTVIFTIFDYVEMISTTSPNTMICSGQEIEIWVNTYNGIPPYTYQWENFPDDNDTIWVSPDTTTTFFVDVIDLCLDTITDSVQVTVFPSPEIDIGNDTVVICEGDTLMLNAGGGYLSYLWQDGSTDSTYSVTEPGMYYVHVVGAGGCATDDSVYVETAILDFSLGADTTICINDSLVLDPGGGYPNYTWQNGSTNQTFTAWTTGTYWVTISNEGCTKTDSIYLYVDDPNVSMTLGNDTTICPGDYITLKPTVGVYNSYLWSTGDSTSTITITQPGTYSLHVVSGCGEADDDIIIGNFPEPNPNLGDDMNLCYGESALLEPTTSFSTYVWQDNSTLPFYTVTQAGVYWVDVTDINGCEGSDTVFVDIANIVDLGEDSLVLCQGESLTLDAGYGFDFYTWSTGEYGVQTIEVDSGGIYSVSVNYYFGCESEDQVLVIEYPLAEAAITGDNEMCDGESVILEAPVGPFDYEWYLDDTQLSDETSITVTQGGKYVLVMSNVCGADSDEKTVELHPLPDVDLGGDVVLFPGENITLDAGNYQSYIWNDDGTLTDRYYTVAYDDISGEDSVWVEVYDGYCKNSNGILIEIFDVEVPNVITPNGDGKNDIFKPGDGWSGVNNHTIMVFNRWGEKVWESNDFPSGWDGKQNGRLVAEGTYFWVLEVYYGPDNVKRVYKGSLAVLGTGS